MGYGLDEEWEYDDSDLEIELEQAALWSRYVCAKNAKVGTKIECPSCGKSHKKKYYQKVFCSNKGRGNCKDYFWNIHPDRIERTRHHLDIMSN